MSNRSQAVPERIDHATAKARVQALELLARGGVIRHALQATAAIPRGRAAAALWRSDMARGRRAPADAAR